MKELFQILNKIFILQFFLKFSSRQHLNVASNLLSNIENDAFQNLKSLKSLNLTENNLRDLSLILPNEIEHFSIASNHLKYWPIANLPPATLRILELQQNQMVELINTGKIEFLSLTLFNISHNRVTRLPSELYFPNLQKFDASFNQLSSIPQYLGTQAPELIVLNLRGNPIKKIEFTTKISAKSLILSELPMLTEFDATQFNSLGK